MLAPGGIEPTTFALLARRSNQLSYGAFDVENVYWKFVINIIHWGKFLYRCDGNGIENKFTRTRARNFLSRLLAMAGMDAVNEKQMSTNA